MNGQSVGYLYDGNQAIAELVGSSVSAAYHPGVRIDEILAKYTASGQKTLLQDALGSVIAQTAEDGGTVNRYAYSPYGESQAIGQDEGNPLQYAGRENDGTGLYYYRARYYDPLLKRFISEDPIGLAGGINVYGYVGGNPVGFVDPDGHGAIGFGLTAIGVLYAASKVYDSYVAANNASRVAAQEIKQKTDALNSSDPGSADLIDTESSTQNLLKETGKFGIDASKSQWSIGKQQAKACPK